ncbi:MAG: hypothetical protein U1E73_03085 [Planctomycetota bacterium]
MPNTDKSHLYAHRVSLVEAAERTQAGIDKTLVTLASAAIGVTLAVLKDIATSGNPAACRTCLMYAWGFLALTLAASLLSLAFSGKLTHAEISSIDRMIRGEDDPPTERRRRCVWSCATLWMNRVSLIAFLIGMLLTIVFAANNLK